MEDNIDTALDAELEIDNSVPEPTAANRDGGAARLDADPISESLDQSIDNLLDEAERETSAEQPPSENQTDNASNDPLVAPTTDENAVQTRVLPDGNGNQTSVNPEQSQFQVDPEIAAIEQPRNLSEKNQSNWRKLQETATTYKQQATQLQSAYEQALQQQGQAQAPEDYQQLKEFRAVFELKNDRNFKEKFDAPLSSAHENIYSIMKSNGAPDSVIEKIKQEGGPEKIDQHWWKENAIDRLPLKEAEDLKKNLLSCYSLNEDRAKQIEYMDTHSREILEMKETYEREYKEAETSIAYNYANEITQQNKAEWARYKEIPQGATQEQVEKINYHNNEVKGYEEKYMAALRPNSAQEKAAVAAAAVLSHRLVAELEREQAYRNKIETAIKRLAEENSKLKGASRMPRQSVASVSQNKTQTLNDRIKMNPSDAIDLGLDEAGE